MFNRSKPINGLIELRKTQKIENIMIFWERIIIEACRKRELTEELFRIFKNHSAW